MANIEKNKNTEEKKEKSKISSIKKAKEKVNQLSWWAKLFLFCFVVGVLSVFSLLVAINIPSVKNSIAQKGIELLNKEFKTSFKTENIEVNFLGDVVISGITARDHHDFEFLKAKKLIGHSDWFDLIFNLRNLKFQKLSLEELDLRVITYKGEQQDNFNLFISKFDTPRDPRKPPFRLTSRIQIENSKISIVNQNQGEDGKWLKAENVKAYVSDLKVVGRDVKLKFNQLSFVTERWGKKHFLETLSGDLEITKQKFAFTDLVLNTDHSLLQGDLIFNLDKHTGWTDFNNKVSWDMKLKKGSALSGYDIGYFIKKWDSHQKYQLSGRMLGILNNFILNQFSIKANHNKIETPKIQFSRLFDKGNFYIKSEQIVANVTYLGLKASLPTFISKKMGGFADEFGKMNYHGSADINSKRLVAKGNLLTDIGQAQMQDFTLSEYSSPFPKYKGNVMFKDLDTRVITKKNEVGLLSGNFNFEGKGFDLNTLSITTKADISSLEFLDKKIHNLHIDGDLIAKKFHGTVKIDDSPLQGEMRGDVDFSTSKIKADIQGDIQRFNMGYWGLSEENVIFKGKMNGKLSMTNVSDMLLETNLSQVSLRRNKEISIPNGDLKLSFEEGQRTVRVDIPNVARGTVIGDFDLANIGDIFQEASNKIFVGNKAKKYYKGQSFIMDFDVHQDLVDYFDENLKIPYGAKVKGNFEGNENDFVFNIQAPTLKYILIKKEEPSDADELLAKLNPKYVISEVVKKDSAVVKGLDMKINTAVPREYWSAHVDRVEYNKSLLKDIRLIADNRGEKLHIDVDLQVGTLEKEKTNQMAEYSANIYQSVNEQNDYVFRFSPTEVKINKFLWMVDATPELNHSITYRRKTKDFLVNHLRLYSGDSELLINGAFKSTKNFDWEGRVRNMEISKIWAILHQDSKIEFQGIADGDIKLKMTNNEFIPEINMKIDNIKVDENIIGNLSMKAQKSGLKNVYDIDAKIKTSEIFTTDKLSLQGTIDNNTKSPTLDLKTKLNKFDLSFIQPFVENVFTNFRGNASGDIAVNGTLKDINYGGDISVNDFGLKLNFSGVDYEFDDTVVTLSNGNMFFNLVGVRDSRKNSKGMISIGRVSLSNLSNIGADLLIRSDDLMILNTTQSDFDLFWGKIYAKGDLFVGFGNNTLKLDAKADVLQNSMFTLNSNSTSSVEQFKMLRFLEVNKQGDLAVAEKKKSGIDLNINLDITADKNSTVNVLVGDKVGDISVRGSTENMKFSMNKAGNMSMFGKYLVESGTYISKAILEKTFRIQKGSNLQWNGDVLNPELDITATYNALVSNASEYLGVGSLPVIKVQLQTDITNRLTNPQVKPSIKASEVSSQIKDVMATKLATEEEKVLQFASILALGNFNISNTNASSAIGSGVNVFFQQLSSAFNSISDDFQIDLDYIKGSHAANTGDRASTSLNYKISPRLKIKTGLGIPLSNKDNTQNNYLSGEGIVEYDWSKTVDGSKIFRVYSKPSNVGLISGANAGANQTYGGGIVMSYEFDKIFSNRKKKNKKPKKKNIQDSLKNN